jgi:predicted deacylase
MTFTQFTDTLAGDAPGTATTLTGYRAGPVGAARKVYLQAALHADEQPGTMLLHHLLPRLRDADAAGQLRARFTVMPSINPLGLQHLTLRHHIGRYDPATGINHNRRWPDLFEMAKSRIGALGGDAATNSAVVRDAVAGWIAEQQPRTAAQHLRLVILRECHDADVMLDLHCDSESLPYIYTSPDVPTQDLSDWMGAAATLTATDSGGGSFDEVLPQLFRKAGAANPGKPLPLPLTATVEYRGQADVSDETGKDDARRLWGFLCERGFIDADPGPRPPAASPATPFDATDVVRVPAPGLIAYRVALGDRVVKGQPVADLIALDGADAFIARTPILAGTDGLVLTRSARKYVERGANIMKIVGTKVLPTRAGGYLLED